MTVYARRDAASDAEFFRCLVGEEAITEFVIGLPIHLSGDESPKSREARAFAEWLGELTQLPIRLFDERYSTVEAKQRLHDRGRMSRRKQQQRLDALAAQVLLQAYLERCTVGGLPDPDNRSID